jgi:hypothetical protein
LGRRLVEGLVGVSAFTVIPRYSPPYLVHLWCRVFALVRMAVGGQPEEWSGVLGEVRPHTRSNLGVRPGAAGTGTDERALFDGEFDQWSGAAGFDCRGDGERR